METAKGALGWLLGGISTAAFYDNRSIGGENSKSSTSGEDDWRPIIINSIQTAADGSIQLEFTSKPNAAAAPTQPSNLCFSSPKDLNRRLKLGNPVQTDTLEDLTALPNLHEPGVLHVIQRRYQEQLIYTWSGIVLIAVNPFSRLHHLYSPDVARAYCGSGIGGTSIASSSSSSSSSSSINLAAGNSNNSIMMEPHLYAVAEEAYRRMIHFGQNQSIIVSGESGAGKTVSAKYIMRYFAAVGDFDNGGDLTVAPPASVKQRSALGLDCGGEQMMQLNSQQRKRNSVVMQSAAVVSAAPISAGDGWEGAAISAVEEQVLATNPIMEAFGNAKTSRNDNSSRFGKYIQIQFNAANEIIGASIRTYLLERSRVVYQPSVERNYHIFYQLLSGAPLAERKQFGLRGGIESFHYLRQGGPESAIIYGVDDAEDFASTEHALSLVGISVQRQWEMFRLLAGILHLGNINSFVDHRNSAAAPANQSTMIEDNNDGDELDKSPLGWTAKLLGVSAKDLSRWLRTRRIKMRSEEIFKDLTAVQSVAVRDSLAKFIYNILFDWLVGIVNSSLAVNVTNGSSSNNSNTDISIPVINLVATTGIKNFIGVLDIYGFEHFQRNSFEQLCINYANEKLQQEFNQHVFKLEQEEYVREGIDWSYIDYNDNQPCIDLIEGKLGILDLLDEESRLPSGSDSQLITKYYQQFTNPPSQNPHFQKPRFSTTAFTIVHYAHPVVYETEGFLEKNRDTVPEELLVLLQQSDFEFCRKLFSPILLPGTQQTDNLQPQSAVRTSGTASGKLHQKPTLGSEFKRSLASLMQTVRETNVHYIRCIKPNEEKRAFHFNRPNVMQQLRACGVLETIRISCAGFPGRFGFSEFNDRYKLLLPSDGRLVNDSAELSRRLLEQSLSDPDKYRLGKTKIFLRAGQIAMLERLRTERVCWAAVRLQANVRRYLERKRFLAVQRATCCLQRSVRSWLARKRLLELRQQRAAVQIQRYWRGYSCRCNYRQYRRFIIQLQSICRSFLARRLASQRRQHRAAIRIQSVYRMHRCRRQFQHDRNQIITAQSCVRRHQARRQLRRLRAEAKSIRGIQQKAGALEKKVFELTQSLAERESQLRHINDRLTASDAQCIQWRQRAAEAQKLHQDSELKLAATKAERDSLAMRLKDSDGARLRAEQQATDALAELEAVKQEVQQRIQRTNETQPPAAPARGVADQERITQLLSENAMLKDKLARSLGGAGNRSLSQATIEHEPTVNQPDPTQQPGNATHANHQSSFRAQSLRNRSRVAAVDSSSSFATGIISNTIIPGSPAGEDGHQNNNNSNTNNNNNSNSSAQSIASNQNHDRRRQPLVDYLPNTQPHSAQLLESWLRNRELEQELLHNLLITPTAASLPDPQRRQRRDCHYPAHIIAFCAVQCWRLLLVDRLRVLLGGALRGIRSAVRYDDPGNCAYWLSNLIELHSLLCAAIGDYPTTTSGVAKSAVKDSVWEQMHRYRTECEQSAAEIYGGWMKELRRQLAQLAVPCILDHQGLPGFIDNTSSSGAVFSGAGGFLNRWMGGSSSVGNNGGNSGGNSGYSSQSLASADGGNSINKLTQWFSRLNSAMVLNHMEDGIRRQTVNTLIRFSAYTAFNQLLVRKAYCTWRRGMQIQYNVTHLEEWCVKNENDQATLYLEPIMQAAKLLQLNKCTMDDVETMYDLCFLLTPVQIRKLLTMFTPGEFETPVAAEILQAVSERCVDGVSGGGGGVMLDVQHEDISSEILFRTARAVEKIERYLPESIASQVPRLKHLLTI